MNKINRNELKYILPIDRIYELKNKFKKILQEDSHSVNGGYTVRTQYYDSLYDEDLKDNLSGIIEKKKIRLRTYASEDSIFKLEYKHKYNIDSTKYSILISNSEAEAMQHHSYDFLATRGDNLSLFIYYKLLEGCYRPKTIIDYDRMAYMDVISDLRITIDTNIKAAPYPYDFFKKNLNMFPIIELSFGVLEIKYRAYIPSYIKSILNTIDTSAQANSKYLNARLIL